MKRVSNKLFAYFSVLVMVLGFFLPNFNYVVKATEVEDNIVLNNNYELVDNILFLEKNQVFDFSSVFNLNNDDVIYNSDDINIFEVNELGVIFTGENKGYSVLTLDADGITSYYVVVVDYERQEFIDVLASQIEWSIDIDYTELDFYSKNDLIIDGFKKKIDTFFNKERKIYNFSFSEGVDEDTITLGICVESLCSKVEEIEYNFYGVYSEDTVNIGVGETKKVNAIFTEGHLSNIRYNVLDTEVASVDKDGIVKGKKAGKTYLRIFDKYYNYFYHIPIWVDKDTYIRDSLDYISNNTFVINGANLSSNDDSNVLFELLNVLSDKGIVLSYLFEYDSYSVEWDDESSRGVFTFTDDESKTLDVTVELKGIYLYDQSIAKIEVEKSLVTGLDAFDNGLVLVSSDEDICSVNDLSVFGVNPGICHITYKLGEYENHRTFIVGEEDLALSMADELQLMPNVIDLKLDPFDATRINDDEYKNLYKAAVRDYCNNVIDVDGITCDVKDVLLNDDDTDTIEVYLMHDGYYYSYNNFNYLSNMYSSGTKTIEINYLGHTDGWEELGESIISQLPKKYTLSTEQFLSYKIFSNSEEDIHLFSDFENDLKKICQDCTYHVYGGYGGVDAPGLRYKAMDYTVLKNDEPIASSYVMFSTNYYLAIDEIRAGESIEMLLIDKIKNAYSNIRDYNNRNMFLSSFMNVFGDEDDLEIDIDYISSIYNVFSYNVNIDNNSFILDLYLDIDDNSDYAVKLEEIILSEDCLEMVVGTSKQIDVVSLSPDYAENTNVTWESTDKRVAIVENGKVTAVGVGMTTIIIESEDKNVKTTISVNVKPLLVESIILNEEILNLTVGDTFDLIATINPLNATNTNLNWISSNSNVVTVENGKVTAIGSGNAVITVESVDGGASTSINVSVIAKGLAGDIDGDGKVNIVDLVKLRKHLAKIEELTGDPYKGADFNKDGTVNIKDLVNMRQHLAK